MENNTFLLQNYPYRIKLQLQPNYIDNLSTSGTRGQRESIARLEKGEQTQLSRQEEGGKTHRVGAGRQG